MQLFKKEKVGNRRIVNILGVKFKYKVKKYNYSPEEWSQASYSQEGEDLIVSNILSCKSNGFYIDVGAHHPARYSNTFFFYSRGWRGLNIDPLPGTKALFDEHRPKDITLEMGVAKQKSELTYHLFKDPAYNGFDAEISKERANVVSKLIGTKTISCLPLAEILSTHLPPNQEIDFMSVDAEGLDLDVLESNDWKKFRPKLIIVEILNCDTFEDVLKTQENAFLKSKGYNAVAKSKRSVIFKSENV